MIPALKIMNPMFSENNIDNGKELTIGIPPIVQQLLSLDHCSFLRIKPYVIDDTFGSSSFAGGRSPYNRPNLQHGVEVSIAWDLEEYSFNNELELISLFVDWKTEINQRTYGLASADTILFSSSSDRDLSLRAVGRKRVSAPNGMFDRVGVTSSKFLVYPGLRKIPFKPPQTKNVIFMYDSRHDPFFMAASIVYLTDKRWNG